MDLLVVRALPRGVREVNIVILRILLVVAALQVSNLARELENLEAVLQGKIWSK